MAGYELLGHQTHPPPWIAVVPAFFSVAMVVLVREQRTIGRVVGQRARSMIRDLPAEYWRVVAVLTVLALLNFPDALIGSGTVEAGCKAVVGQRLKLSGMRGNGPGATGILTLGCDQAGNRSSTYGHGRLRAPRAADRLRCRASCGYA